MKDQPGQPCQIATELQLADLSDGAVAGDRRHAALVAVLERGAVGGIVAALDGVLDQLGRIFRALDRALRHAGHPGHRHQIPDDEHVRVSLDSEVGLHDDTPGAVDFGAIGLLGDHPAQRTRRHPRGPHLAGTFDAPFGAVFVLDRDPLVVDSGHHRVELDLDAHLLQPAPCHQAQLLAHRRQHRGGGIHQDHVAIPWLDGPKRPGQRALGEFGDLACQLDAGRARADHHKREAAPALGLVGGHLGRLERAKDPAAQLQGVVDRLHSRRERGELVVAEIGLLRPGGDDEAVKRRDRLHCHQPGRHRLRCRVDRIDVTQQHPDILLPPQDQSRARRDLAFGQYAGGHLIEQWLKQMACRLRDEGDVDISPLQRLRRGQAPEPGPDDDDPMALGGGRGHAHRGPLL